MQENKKEILNTMIDFKISSRRFPSAKELGKYGYDELMFIDMFGGYGKALLLAETRKEQIILEQAGTNVLLVEIQ
ncbi:hypothetical protein [Clostridium rectalis]|uniref:hypothetical protein n=1 Tax=Clostridium rectalis TaxID=2040295 RepID=UPI001FAAEE39|nr:hypothetical protein [Clostridium rectalis]